MQKQWVFDTEYVVIIPRIKYKRKGGLRTGENITTRGNFKACGSCQDRKPGCHDRCGRYLAEKILNDDYREKDRRRRYADNAAEAHKIDALVRITRKKTRER